MRYLFVIAWAFIGCGTQVTGQGVDPERGTEATEAGDQGPPPPAGATCSGTCATGQLCVEGHCRYRQASAAGEILAAGAAGQFAVSDAAGALASYDRALEAYAAADAPAPPEVLCGAAKAALRLATSQETPESREIGATRADACFRGSLPGAPLRVEVQTMISRLRFDGLDMGAFDQSEPAPAFFTLEPTRPTFDAVEVALSIGNSDEGGFEELSEALRSEAAHHAIATCFVAEWERSHERQRRADLLMRYRTQLRDMGDYDMYQPEVEIIAGSGDGEADADAFSTCLAENLAATLMEDLSNRRGSTSHWEEPFEISVRVN
ncbi:MAG: hypothetical protein DRJ42_11210 [Deltaproteobacteria bacterium]|nr:MAG: hypothetical protein DRJ42_11210 [Deltaproteobacteria bacterium]